jgi:hypothetical protein
MDLEFLCDAPDAERDLSSLGETIEAEHVRTKSRTFGK